VENLAIKISCDPKLLKIVNQLKDPKFKIPEYDKEFKTLHAIKSTDKGVLVSKSISPDDYQTQKTLIGMVQHCLDQVQEMNNELYEVQHFWKEVFNDAVQYINLTYFTELNELKDGIRKAVLAAALHPIQEGLDKLQYLIERGEQCYKHLNGTNWNIKESTLIIKEYLASLKYGHI